MSRLTLATALIGLLTAPAPAEPSGSLDGHETRHAAARAAAWLWSQQADDGAWRSDNYAVLRSGQALTPFVLHTLLAAPPGGAATPDGATRPEGAAGRALGFLREHVDEQGALGRSDPDIAEYPVYSTSYALRCLLAVRGDAELRGDGDDDLIRRAAAFLRSAQFQQENGFARSHPAFGGWGFDAPQRPGAPGHMDLAHTRRALEALRDAAPMAAGEGLVETDRPERGRAEWFLRVVQRHPAAAATPAGPFDGGFFFSPVVGAANKGRTADSPAPHFRSYATATCDGVLALLAAGVAADDERVTRAADWLRRHEDFDYPQGAPRDHPEPWGEAIRFYHYAARAEAYAALNLAGDWRGRLAACVARRQRADGSFRNGASALMKEDDPVLCTTLALTALLFCAR